MQIKKAILLAFLVTSYSMQQQQNHFSIGLWLVMKSGFYMTTSNGQLSGWNEKEFQSTCQSQTCAQKRSWSLFGGLLPVWSTRAFWIPAKPLYLRSMLNKSMRWRGLVLHNNARVAQSTHQRLNKLGCEVLPHLPYSHDHSPTNYHFFKHLDNFLQGKHFHNQEAAENAFQEFMESWCTDFYATGINKLISCWQKCVDCNGSYSD